MTIWKVYVNARCVSSSPCNETSSRGIMCCLLYFFLPITIFPYTNMSLKRKNWRGFGLLRHILVSTPSPTNTLPGIKSCSPELPKQLSTICILRAFASLFTKKTYEMKVVSNWIISYYLSSALQAKLIAHYHFFLFFIFCDVK